MARVDLPPIAWDIDVPLLTNRHMLGAIAKAMLGAAIGVAFLVAVPLAVQGEWEVIGNVAVLLAAIGAGLFALALLIMAVPFRNRLRTHFQIDGDGVSLRQIDRTARFGNRAAFWAGLVLGRPSAAGTGALAIGQEEQSLAWTGAFTANYEPATHSIAFRNGWRTLLRVYCLPANYEAAVALVAAHMAAGNGATRTPARSPLRGYLGRTLLVVGCTIPLFLVANTFGLSPFIPFLLLCFALAMVWLVRPLALVVLGALAWLTVALGRALVEPRASSFGGAPYRRYDVVGGDDWALLMLAGVAVGVLAWYALRVWRGRLVPALTQDWADGGDG